jgi:transketolase
LVWEAIKAAQALANRGVRAEVLNVHTIKPLDVEAIVKSLKRTGCAVTAEEHQRNGGLGALVSQVAATHYPVPVEHVAVDDSFGESGTPAQLMEKYGLNSEAIQTKVDAVMRRAVVVA